MSDFLTGDGRTHMRSGLMRESLVSRSLIEQTESRQVQKMVPDVSMIAVGGRSIMDRGAEAILPLVAAIAELKERHRFVLGVGGGARSRHTLAIGMDLGLPVGGLARIVGGMEENNRDILQFLLAPHGGITFIKDHFQDLQLFLANGMVPICIGQPPYHFWEPPPMEAGGLPENGSDVGLFLMAEVIGAERVLFVKDVDGVYDQDPRYHEDARLIHDISARALLDGDYADLPVERELLRSLENARNIAEVCVLNGLDTNNLARALDGERVGTRIYSSRHTDNAEVSS